MQEVFGGVYPENTHIQVSFKVNKFGDLVAYKTDIIQKEKTFLDSLGFKSTDVLTKALLEAAPFQPFPKRLDRMLEKVYVLTIVDGELYIADRYNSSMPTPYERFSNNGKPRNPKRVADTKVTSATVMGYGLDETGRIIYSSKLASEVGGLYWTPVLTKNNMVTIDCKYKNGKLVEPIFMKKSDIRKANEAALDAMYSLNLQDMSKFAAYPVVKIQGVFAVK